MLHAIFLFPSSLDVKEVDDIVDNHLVPSAKSSNPVALTTSVGPLMGAGGPSPYQRVVEISHETIEDMMAAANAGGKELDARMKKLGIQILAFEVHDL